MLPSILLKQHAINNKNMFPYLGNVMNDNLMYIKSQAVTGLNKIYWMWSNACLWLFSKQPTEPKQLPKCTRTFCRCHYKSHCNCIKASLSISHCQRQVFIPTNQLVDSSLLCHVGEGDDPLWQVTGCLVHFYKSMRSYTSTGVVSDVDRVPACTL